MTKKPKAVKRPNWSKKPSGGYCPTCGKKLVLAGQMSGLYSGARRWCDRCRDYKTPHWVRRRGLKARR